MMTIDEAITHAKEVACTYDESVYEEYKCRKEHEQLAEWLTAYKSTCDLLYGLDDNDSIYVGYLRSKLGVGRII